MLDASTCHPYVRDSIPPLGAAAVIPLHARVYRVKSRVKYVLDCGIVVGDNEGRARVK